MDASFWTFWTLPRILTRETYFDTVARVTTFGAKTVLGEWLRVRAAAPVFAASMWPSKADATGRARQRPHGFCRPALDCSHGQAGPARTGLGRPGGRRRGTVPVPAARAHPELRGRRRRRRPAGSPAGVGGRRRAEGEPGRATAPRATARAGRGHGGVHGPAATAR